jgi:hypothetical protein
LRDLERNYSVDFSISLNTQVKLLGDFGAPGQNALEILLRDMSNVLSPCPSAPKNEIQFVQDPSLDAESCKIDVSKDAIKASCGGGSGAMSAALFISGQYLKVTPFWYWNDQNFEKADSLSAPCGKSESPSFAVKHRGWFVNDETLIDHWDNGEGSVHHWKMIFEALLRCGGNLVIPGTGQNESKYRELAVSMGLRTTHHHAQPLGAEMFASAHPDCDPSYFFHPKLFEELWEDAVKLQKSQNPIWGLGFRGQGDRPFWDDDNRLSTSEERGAFLGKIMERQVAIVKKHCENPVFCANIYGEAAELHKNGHLRFPEGTIKIWADNGYGVMESRRQGNSNPRIPSLPKAQDPGPHGVYFHCSFHDLQASNHLTMSPNSGEFLVSELRRAFRANARELLIVNCGSVKPHLPMLHLMSVMWRKGAADAHSELVNYATLYYKNAGVADLLEEYSKFTARYGTYDYDRAGEQLWHHPVREMARGWMTNRKSPESLKWFSKYSLKSQIERLKIFSRGGYEWKQYSAMCMKARKRLGAAERRLFDSSILLQARLQEYGSRAAYSFCRSFENQEYQEDGIHESFRLAWEARRYYGLCLEAMSRAATGRWKGFYDGDCLTNVKLSFDVMEILAGYIRIIGEGPSFNVWEREMLLPENERGVMLLSSKKRHLSNDELGKALNQIHEARERSIPGYNGEFDDEDGLDCDEDG